MYSYPNPPELQECSVIYLVASSAFDKNFKEGFKVKFSFAILERVLKVGISDEICFQVLFGVLKILADEAITVHLQPKVNLNEAHLIS